MDHEARKIVDDGGAWHYDSSDQPDGDEFYPNRAGKTAVALGEHGTIHVPDGYDEHVPYETPDGVKHVWVNPDAVEKITDPGPDDDVIWDGSIGGYIPRVVRVDASEAIGTSGAGTVTP